MENLHSIDKISRKRHTHVLIDRRISRSILSKDISRAETEIGSEKKEISKAVSVKEKERPVNCGSLNLQPCIINRGMKNGQPRAISRVGIPEIYSY